MNDNTPEGLEVRLYEFSPSATSVQVSVPWDLAQDINGRSVLSDWQVIPVEMITVDESGHELDWNDFLACPKLPCVGERGFAVLSQLFAHDGELLPVTSSIGDFWLFNVTHLEPLDEDRSVLDRTERGDIFWIDEPAFAPEVLEQCSWFRPAQVPDGMPYMTTRCLDQIRDRGLTGIDPIAF
jgi:hypothetical protein